MLVTVTFSFPPVLPLFSGPPWYSLDHEFRLLQSKIISSRIIERLQFLVSFRTSDVETLAVVGGIL